jgi:FdhD protein
MPPQTPPPGPRCDVDVEVERWRDGRRETALDVVADERPVQFLYRGIPHVVMLATPADLEDLAVGFTWTEAIATPAEIRSVEAVVEGESLEVRIDIAPDRFAELLKRERNLAGRTGCGLCGAATVDDAIRPPDTLSQTLQMSATELEAALEQLAAQQPLNARSGAVHAAAWVVPGRGVVVVREDVGRHNALDKLIGALVRSGATVSEGYVLITSRASYEIVQKAASVGIEAVAAVSAPTAFAVRAAKEAGLTLIGFTRPGRHVVYAHPERMVHSARE